MNTIKFLQSSVYKLALRIFSKICGWQLKLQLQISNWDSGFFESPNEQPDAST